MIFEDEAVFQQAGTMTRTWAPVGVGWVVLSEPCKKSVKAMGAVTVSDQPKWYFRFVPVFNSHTFLAFLKQLVRRVGKKIFLILDNARYHHARLLQAWLHDHRRQIELCFLPPYSPELNGAEPIWKLTRRRATHNRHFPTRQALKTALFRRFNRFQGNPASLASIIREWM